MSDRRFTLVARPDSILMSHHDLNLVIYSIYEIGLCQEFPFFFLPLKQSYLAVFRIPIAS